MQNLSGTYTARPARSGTTTAAAVLHFVLVSICGVAGVLILFLIFAFGASDTTNADADRALSGLALIVAVFLVGYCGIGFWLGVALLRCKAWARVTLIVLYGLALFFEVLNIAQERRSGGLSLIIGVAMLILLLLPSTNRDFTSGSSAYGAPVAYAPMAAAAHHPPGWYPDPSGKPSLRYWDGRAWTAHEHAQPPG